jgi:hypothetical protein
MTPAPSNFKYPDGIVLTLKTSNHADHYFVERAFALQLAGSIKDSLMMKKGKPQHKPTDTKPSLKSAVKKVLAKPKPKPD